MANDGWASDYLRQLNTQGPGNPGNVVSHQVRYRAPDTSDIPLAPGQNPEDSVYSNAPGARMGQLKPASGYRAPAGGGWDVNSSDTNLRFSDESGGKRYARPKRAQSRSRGAPANGVKTSSAPLSGADVTAAVMKAVKADGNTSFANWRQSLQRQGWDGDPSRIKYDPSTGKFVDTGGGVNGGAVTPEQTEAQASHRAESYPAEVGSTPVGGAQPAPAKTESSAQPAPAKTEGGAQPAPAKTDTQTPAGQTPAKTEGSTQSAPADDHEQEVKAAVDEFLKQHPEDGEERLKSIYEAVDSQNIKDDAAHNLAVLAEIQKASTASGDTSDVDNLQNNPGNTGAADLSKAVSSERQAQTESGVNDYQDQIREGINWLRMFHAPDDPAGVRAEAAITAIGNMLRSSDPERYKHAVEELEKQKSYVIAANNEQIANDITEGSKVTGDPAALEPRAAAARQFFINDQKNKLAGRYFADALGARAFHDAMDGNIVTPDSIRAAEYVRQLRAANAAKAQAAAEAAEQRSDNPEGWL